MITKSVGGTRVAQLVSTAFRTSKKSRTMLCAQALAAGDGLPNATCATLGISTTVAFGSVLATSGPNEGAVCAVVLRRDDKRRDAALGHVPDGAIDRRHVPDVAVGAHELEVGRVPMDRRRKGRKRALSRGLDARLVS